MGEDGDRGGGGLGSLPPEPPGPSPRLAPPLFPHQERALSRQGSLGSDASGGSTPTASGGGRDPRATAFGSTGATPPHLAGAPFMGNPLYESSPSDARGVSGVIGGGVRKAGGIGLSQKEAPESHLRKAKAGGLLTKLPFGATASATARPKIRFFRVTPDGRELQWGDPRDAAKPALPSRLALADVSAVVVGHDTAAFERFKRRAAPPAMCFSLVCDARTVDLFAGTPNEAAQWSGALDHLARLARDKASEQRPSDVTHSNDTIGQHKQPPGLARTSSNASQQSQGSTGSPSSVKRSAPVRFTPAPRSDADVALDFVPMASQPPTPDGHVSLDLRDGIERDGGWGTRGVVYGAGVVTGGRAVDDGIGRTVGSRSERVPEDLTGSALEPVAPAFATTTQLAAGAARWRERAARGAVDPGVSEGRRGAGARGRAAGKTAGEDVVEAFSRARHGRTKELDRLFQLERVDPAVRDQHGLTLLHIAAQNNQRKAAKLVLKRTDFATDPPRLSLIDAQTSAGHTALHFAFAYGYKELGKYLLSLGADDTVANVHGMTCYEGLDPDEPPRDCLNTPEMRELARSAELRRRVDAMRPGAGAGAGGGLGLASSRGGTITHPLGRPSGVAGLARDSGAFTARGGAGSGTAPSSSRGGGGGWEGSEYDVGSEYGVAYPYTPRDVPGYGPGNGPGNGPGAYGGGHPGYPPNPYAAPGAVAPPPPPYPAYPPTLTPGFHSGYNPMDPMGAAAFAAQQQMAAAAAMAAQMQAMQMSSPAGSMGSTHSPMGSHWEHGSHGAVNLGGSMPTGFQPNRSKAHPAGGTVSSRGSAVGGGGVASSGASAATNGFSRGDVESDEPPEPPSPIMGPGRKGSSHRSGGRHDAEAAWERALDSRRRRKSDSSNLDSSDDDEFEVNKKQQQNKQQQQREQREREREENKRPHPRRRAGAEASARVAAAGGRRGDRAARDEALDREAALRAAALRKHGYHSSDSDSPTSASEAESSRRRDAPAPRSVVAGSNPPPGAVVVGPGRRERAERSRAAAVDGPAGEGRDAGGEDRDGGVSSSREIRDIDVAAREEAARVREEKRRQRAGAMRGATAVGETGRTSCLPARTASKIAMVLGAHPRADPRSVRDVLATGSLDASAGGVTLEALRAIRTVVPTPADIATCRATHGMGAAADAKMASAALADRFVHEMARVHRADAKLDAIILRETFADRADDLETALVLVKDASERACRSDALGRLLDIVVALSAILEKEETGKAAGGKPGDARSRYKLASLARLATVPAKSSAGDRTNGLGGDTLLHHLSKTVEAKAGAGDVLRWAESSGEGFRKASAASAPAEVRERVAELRRAVRDVEAEAAACERDSQKNGASDGSDEDVNSRLAASLRSFAAEALVRLDVLWATSEAADESAARLLVAFGPAPKGTAPGDVLRTLGEFAEAFERATAENRRARMERGKE